MMEESAEGREKGWIKENEEVEKESDDMPPPYRAVEMNEPINMDKKGTYTSKPEEISNSSHGL